MFVNRRWSRSASTPNRRRANTGWSRRLLGWPAAKIEVIDADLGLSGRSAERRSGFREVVSRVCLGEVGAIFGPEVSRLARSSADLARLLELARLTDTLVIDTDGMYDLREFNDRLLLGLKGAMLEAELHILAGRLQGAKRAAAERGDLRFPLPVGSVRDADGATVIDPDQEVFAAVTDVFAAFQATGSAYRLLSGWVVLDAANIAAGPLAVVPLPFRVPLGLHGNWFGLLELGLNDEIRLAFSAATACSGTRCTMSQLIALARYWNCAAARTRGGVDARLRSGSTGRGPKCTREGCLQSAGAAAEFELFRACSTRCRSEPSPA
jgi:DNA invertase Pin-like site-specific DNA recombinase